MNITEKPMPESMLSAASSAAGGARLRACARGMELLLFEALPRVKMHGLKFSASERPSVILGGRKQSVEGVF